MRPFLLSLVLDSLATAEPVCPVFLCTCVQVQDEAAGMVVAMLDPRPGETLLDACAAPGGKTLFAAARCVLCHAAPCVPCCDRKM